MSHEIRTPMNGILGNIELLRGTLLSEDQRTFLDAIESSARAMLSYLGSSLDALASDSEGVMIAPDDVDITSLLDDIIRLFRPAAELRRLTLSSRIYGGVQRRTRIDALRVRQLLIRLVGDAVRYIENGDVQISVRSSIGAGSDTLRFEVRCTTQGGDAGCEDERAAASRALSEMVEALGGTIGSHTEREGGSVWFTVPMPTQGADGS